MTTSINEFISRIENMKKGVGSDLSVAEDLSIAVMNLISLEEHFFFTAAKTKKDTYYDTAKEIREMRKELLAKLMPLHEGETWCISKHLLSASMRLVEVGNKLQSSEKIEEKNEAKKMFQDAYRVYSIFWALKLKLVKGEKIENVAKSSATFEDLVAKLADCCKE